MTYDPFAVAAREGGDVSDVAYELSRKVDRLQRQLPEATSEIQKPHAEIERLRDWQEKATAKVSGVDYTESHMRDNTTPDELRDIVRGLAFQLHEARGDVETKILEGKLNARIAAMVDVLLKTTSPNCDGIVDSRAFNEALKNLTAVWKGAAGGDIRDSLMKGPPG